MDKGIRMIKYFFIPGLSPQHGGSEQFKQEHFQPFGLGGGGIRKAII
jgi:hypothetical protein